MAKKATVQTEGRQGVQWAHVKGASLSAESQKLYQQYVNAFKKANDIASELKDQVQSEWAGQYPDGINGKTCIFNAIGGVLLYVMKDAEKPKRESKQLDMNAGDDVFNRPPR
jgi:hypothetical protein